VLLRRKEEHENKNLRGGAGDRCRSRLSEEVLLEMRTAVCSILLPALVLIKCGNVQNT
jgi:hypothetical protein